MLSACELSVNPDSSFSPLELQFSQFSRFVHVGSSASAANGEKSARRNVQHCRFTAGAFLLFLVSKHSRAGRFFTNSHTPTQATKLPPRIPAPVLTNVIFPFFDLALLDAARFVSKVLLFVSAQLTVHNWRQHKSTR